MKKKIKAVELSRYLQMEGKLRDQFYDKLSSIENMNSFSRGYIKGLLEVKTMINEVIFSELAYLDSSKQKAQGGEVK